MKQVFFSIITATKNPENILPTLNSLKNQNFKNYESIIIDSSSSHSDGRVDSNGRVIIGIDSTSAGVNQLQKVISSINNCKYTKIH